MGGNFNNDNGAIGRLSKGLAGRWWGYHNCSYVHLITTFSNMKLILWYNALIVMEKSCRTINQIKVNEIFNISSV